MCNTSVSRLLTNLQLNVRKAIVDTRELFIESFGSCRNNMILFVERYKHIRHSI